MKRYLSHISPAKLSLMVLTIIGAVVFATYLFDTASRHPSRYGLPETILGFKILAVYTTQDDPCMPPNTKRVIFQATATTVEAYLKNPPSGREIIQILKQLTGDEETDWQLQFVGPTSSSESITQVFAQVSEILKLWSTTNHCVQLAGPMPSVTPR